MYSKCKAQLCQNSNKLDCGNSFGSLKHRIGLKKSNNFRVSLFAAVRLCYSVVFFLFGFLGLVLWVFYLILMLSCSDLTTATAKVKSLNLCWTEQIPPQRSGHIRKREKPGPYGEWGVSNLSQIVGMFGLGWGARDPEYLCCLRQSVKAIPLLSDTAKTSEGLNSRVQSRAELSCGSVIGQKCPASQLCYFGVGRPVIWQKC